METRSFRSRRAAGFSLIDLMVALVCVGILTAIALPTYGTAIRKSRRADGIQSLRSVQMAQERWRASNTTYGTTAQILGSATTSPGGWYTIAISNPTATTYTATATAVSGKSQTADSAQGTSCATLTVDQDAPVGQAACWNQ